MLIDSVLRICCFFSQCPRSPSRVLALEVSGGRHAHKALIEQRRTPERCCYKALQTHNMAYDCFYTTKKTVKQGSKNISIKMLKDVGMTVPKSRETGVVYIYAATQGMRDYIYMQQDRG